MVHKSTIFTPGGGGGVTTINGLAGAVVVESADGSVEVTTTGSDINLVARPQSSFVFRPNGVAGGNVYTDFAALYADLNAFAGERVIIFDDPGITHIPAGTYDLSNVICHVPNSNNVILDDGVIFTGTWPIQNLCTFNSHSNSPIMTFTSGIFIMYLLAGSNISCATSSNVIVLDNTGSGIAAVALFVKDTSALQTSAAEIIKIINKPGILIVLDNGANIQSSTLKTDSTSTIIVDSYIGSAQFSPTQPNALGSITVNLNDKAVNHAFTSSSGLSSVNTQAAIDEVNAKFSSITGITLTLAKLTTLGANGSITISANGVITAYTAPT